MYRFLSLVSASPYLDLILDYSEFRKKKSEELGKPITVLHNQYGIDEIRKAIKVNLTNLDLT